MAAAEDLGLDVPADVPPCDDLGDVPVGEWRLCVGCAEALEVLGELVGRIRGGRTT